MTASTSIRQHLSELRGELPQALALAVMTAVTTLVLVLMVASVTGGENVEHRHATACFAHDTTELIRRIVLATPNLRERINLDQYPPVDVSDIDCAAVYEQLVR